MEHNIIQDYESLGLGEEEQIAGLVSKFNSELKKCGFKKAVLNQITVNKDIIEEELTIHFKPSFGGGMYENRSCTRNNFYAFRGSLRQLKGGDYYGDYYSLLNDAFEEQISLKVKFENKEYEIGHYLPLRNVVLIYISAYQRWEYGLENEFMLKVLEYVKGVVKTYKIKCVDITKAREKIMITKFTNEINLKISEWDAKVDNANVSKKQYEEKVVDSYRTIKLGGEMVIELKTFITKIKEGLMKKVDEVKTLKFVKSAKLTNEGLEIKFDEIHIMVNGENIRMGNYTVTLLPKTIKIVNDDPVDHGGILYHSPHIKDRGICFGSQKTMAYKLLGELDFKKLTHFLWLYLNSYNQGDTYLPMRDWITARKNDNVVPDGEDGEEGYDGS